MVESVSPPLTAAASEPVRLILDTDPGIGAPGADIDDGFAILLTLASPELDLLGLTIVNGNAELEAGCQSASALLDRLGDATTPVHAGAKAPLERDMREVRSLFTHILPNAGQESEYGSERPLASRSAAEWMVEQIRAQPHEVTVAAIGPMTNLATALAIDSSIASLVKEFVLMAGSATTLAQNVTPVADFNSFVDPDALQIVLNSGAPIRMVGVDQTYRVRLSRRDASRLRASGTTVGTWIADCTDAWIDFNARAYPNRKDHQDHAFMHDPLTIAAITHPELLRWEPANVQVETRPGLTYGTVVANRGLCALPMGSPNAVVAVDTDVEGFQDLFIARLMALIENG